jgi:hypothetical protein
MLPRSFRNFRLANRVPLVNVAGVVAIVLSVVPVYLAMRLGGSVASDGDLTGITIGAQ